MTDRTIPQITQVPLFPLPNTVFFPNTLLPLHIFEPRYRHMTADALAGDRLLGVALLKPGWEQRYYASPEAYAIAGVGRIIWHERLANGRFNLIVRGLSRIDIERYARLRPYRLAQIRWLPEPSGSYDDAERDRRLLRSLMTQLPPSAMPPLLIPGDQPLEAISLGMLVDLVASHLVVDARQKQAVLEAVELQPRVARLLALIGGIVRRHHPLRQRLGLEPADPTVN